MPRWWPRTVRVEDVRGERKRVRWTQVLETDAGKGVRADYRCVSSTKPQRYVWEQDVAGTPFDRIVHAVSWAVELRPVEGGTEVRLTLERRLRGLSRLGSPMMRRAARRDLDQALDGMERALT